MSIGRARSLLAGWPRWRLQARLAGLLLLLSLVSAVLAARPMDDVLVLDGSTSAADLAGRVRVLEDPERRFSAQAVRSAALAGRFGPAPTRTGDINFGYSDSVFWLRFQVRLGAHAADTVSRRWLLEVGYPTLDRVDVYVGDAQEPMTAGDRQPFSARPVPHRNLVFPIELPAGETIDVTLRVHSEGSLTLPLRLWEPSAFERHNQNTYAALALYYGALAALLLYNLLLYFAIRDRSYIEYVLFVLGMAIGQLSLNGFGNQFLWPEATLWGHLALPIGFALCALFAAMFTRSFLDTRRTAPVLDKLLVASAVLFGAAAVMLFVLPYRAGAVAISFLAQLFSVLAIVCGLRCRQKGVPEAGLYLLAWALVLVGAGLMGARNHGWLPTNALTLYSLQLGSALEMLLLSFALAQRINTLRRERAEAQALALAANEQLVRSLKQSEQLLARSVAQRTRQLRTANQLLRASEQRLQHIAHHDPLTGLANRLLLDDRLAQGIARSARHKCRMGVLLVDLDDFKPVNDQYGHAVGDALLVAVGERLRGSVRTEDTVARLGGDEFVIVLVEIFDPEDLDRVLSAVSSELSRPFQVAGHTIHITASVGSAIYPEGGEDGASLLRTADDAMYRSKGATRTVPVVAH